MNTHILSKAALAAAALLFAGTVQAQNTFPGSGEAGIGTLSPTANLEINRTGYTQPYSTVGATYDANNFTSLKIINYTVPQLINPFSVPPGVLYVPGNTNDILSIWKRSHNGAFADKRVMVITADGKVRIGETAASGSYSNYKLSVDGDMIAKRCVIQVANWADYVFAPGYALPALSEVENFIEQNKHLPGVPTEAEVMEKGVEMGEMNKVLLQKVEELTLYMIRLEKENESMKAAIRELQQGK